MTSELARLRAHFGGRSVLVTGANGFKGSWLLALLEALGSKVSSTGWLPPSSPSLWELSSGFDLSLHRADLSQEHRADALLASVAPVTVLHLGAQALVHKARKAPVACYEANVLATGRLLEAIRKQSSVKAALIVTTDKVYEPRADRPHCEGDPLGALGPYSATKIAVEAMVLAAKSTWAGDRGMGLATARAGNVLGGGDWAEDRLLPDCHRAWESETRLTLRNPRAVRPWQYVLDVLWGYLLLAEALERDPVTHSEPWNFAPMPSELDMPVEEVVRLFFGGLGASPQMALGDPQEAALENPTLRLSAAKAQQRLGWRPLLDARASVEKAARWYQEHAEGRDCAELTRAEVDCYLQERAG